MSMQTSLHASAHRVLVFVLAALCLPTLSACGDDEDFEVAATGPAKKAAAKGGDKLLEAAASADELAYTYDAVNKRDPFKTYFDELVLVESDADDLTDLQRVDLDSLRVVGVITGTATPMALVQDSAGKGYTVKIGTLIGKRFGQVKKIDRNEIVVQEEFRDFTGKRIPVYKPMVLVENGRAP